MNSKWNLINLCSLQRIFMEEKQDFSIYPEWKMQVLEKWLMKDFSILNNLLLIFWEGKLGLHCPLWSCNINWGVMGRNLKGQLLLCFARLFHVWSFLRCKTILSLLFKQSLMHSTPPHPHSNFWNHALISVTNIWQFPCMCSLVDLHRQLNKSCLSAHSNNNTCLPATLRVRGAFRWLAVLQWVAVIN